MLVFHEQGIYPLFVEDILREIDAALERRGISARAASIRAQGAPEMIRDMRRGHVPSVERLRSLCGVLGLEFYVGPPRWRRVEDGGSLPDIPLSALEQSARDLVRLTMDAGGNPVPEDLWPALLARRPNEPPDPAGAPFLRTGPVVHVSPGSVTGTIDEHLWAKLQRDPGSLLPSGDLGSVVKAGRIFMGRRIVEEKAEDRSVSTEDQAQSSGQSARDDGIVDSAYLDFVEIADDSMAPTLPNGGVTMVDSTSTDWDPPSIKVVQFGGNTVFRRIVTDAEGRRLMVCDHPDWPNEPWPADARIVGQAKWVGRWLD